MAADLGTIIARVQLNVLGRFTGLARWPSPSYLSGLSLAAANGELIYCAQACGTGLV